MALELLELDEQMKEGTEGGVDVINCQVWITAIGCYEADLVVTPYMRS
jgi:hypothetical protein